MTYPLIGNYGVTPEDAESRSVWPEGFVVREYSDLFSNWRGRQDLTNYLREYGVSGITGVDTRALTRHIRSAGAMRGIISTSPLTAALLEKVKSSPPMEGRDLVHEVTVADCYSWHQPSPFPFGIAEEQVTLEQAHEGEPPLPATSFW